MRMAGEAGSGREGVIAGEANASAHYREAV